MINGRRIITAIVGVLVVSAVVYADMTPVSRLNAGRRQSPLVCSRADLQYMNFSSPSNCPSIADLDLWSVEFLPKLNAEVRQTSVMQHLQSLTNGHSSFSLCLSALIGLGLCSSAHWVKRQSFSFVPEWYHDGGPFQIGHSFAVMPESLCPTPIYCFIQPVCTVEDSIPQYRLRTVVSFWRKSQFMPVVLASRGPPPVLQGIEALT